MPCDLAVARRVLHALLDERQRAGPDRLLALVRAEVLRGAPMTRRPTAGSPASYAVDQEGPDPFGHARRRPVSVLEQDGWRGARSWKGSVWRVDDGWPINGFAPTLHVEQGQEQADHATH